MKVLWVTNIMLPDIACELGLSHSVREGWLTGIFRTFTESGTDLSVAYPVMRDDIPEKIVVRGASCYSFREDLKAPWKADPSLSGSLERILSQVSPDLIHIFGTEFPHAAAAAEAYRNPGRTLIGLQGICSRIAEDYMALLPDRVVRGRTFRDILRKDSLMDQAAHFCLRAENEKKALLAAGHVTGRTAFDREEALKVNPSLIYHPMNETLRPEFYEGIWNINNTHSHTIMAGQADLPLKGMHFLLEAASLLLPEYPDLKIVIAGNPVTGPGRSLTPCQTLKLSGYGKYLRDLITKCGLWDHIEIKGMLSSSGMKEEYLRSAVFVCPSYIENSPNTLGEAMLLGMPVIASDAGGIPSMLGEKEGLLFPRGDVPALSNALAKLFDMEDNGNEALFSLCENARNRALRTHDPEENRHRLLRIYHDMTG
ncbi:MAG: glycosyltransferase family 4 protein [Lachnospiraceae bacterium]|nr:glycosyltransferase family 4 protein [Lachnospiraceae bacterium]